MKAELIYPKTTKLTKKKVIKNHQVHYSKNTSKITKNISKIMKTELIYTNTNKKTTKLTKIIMFITLKTLLKF